MNSIFGFLALMCVVGCSATEEANTVGAAVEDPALNHATHNADDQEGGSVGGVQILGGEHDFSQPQVEAAPGSLRDLFREDDHGMSVEQALNGTAELEEPNSERSGSGVRTRRPAEPTVQLEQLEVTSSRAVDELRDVAADTTGTARASELMGEMDQQLEGAVEHDELFGSEPGEGEVDSLFGE